MKYIDAEKLYEYLEQVSEFYPRYADNFLDNAVINVINGIKTFIASLQQDEKAVELEMCSQAYWEERGWMMIPPDVTLKGIESLLEQVRKKPQQEQPEPPTCKSCGFYENNCPFIRDKFIPYPNRVCKDYTYSVMKEQPKEDIEKEYAEFVEADPVYSKLVNGIVGKAIARHFYELGINARKK